MSSGLRSIAPQDPDFDEKGPYPDHLYLYTGSVDSFEYAATRPLQWPPNTVGRYRNTDPVLINYLIRLAVEKRKVLRVARLMSLNGGVADIRWQAVYLGLPAVATLRARDGQYHRFDPSPEFRPRATREAAEE